MKKVIAAILIMSSIITMLFYDIPDQTVAENYTGAGSIMTGSLKDGFTEYAAYGDYRLLVETASGVFCVEKMNSTDAWYSSPYDREDDEYAKGKLKMDMFSTLLITYADPETGKINTSNSYTSCVRKESYVIVKTDNGVRFVYSFIDEGFVIPFEVKLNDKGFTANVDLSEIKEDKNFKLYDIAILPYMSAGGVEDSGYIMVPDGSGAVINFNNGKSSHESYTQPIYGRDENFDQEQARDNTQVVRLPVYGISRNDSGLFAIISQGAGLASINADVSYKKTKYNNVYASFSVRGIDTYKMGQNLGIAVKISNILQESNMPQIELQVDYFTLGNDNNDYNGMAAICRDYYENNGYLKKVNSKDSPLFLEILGGVKKTKSFIGIPVQRKEQVTSYREAEEMLDSFIQAGVSSVSIKYNNWSDASIGQRPQSKPEASALLGGRKALLSLLDMAKKNRSNVYLNIDLVKTSKWSLLINRFNSSTRTIAQTLSQKYHYNKATGFKDLAERPEFLIRPSKWTSLADVCSDKMNKFADAGISSDSMSEMLYSDFYKKSPVDRHSSMLIAETALESISNGREMLVSGGNVYTLKSASALINVPFTNSRFYIEDESIPFYQMVVHGYYDYSGEAINLADDPEMFFLETVSNGALLHVYFIASEYERLISTKYDNLISPDVNIWFDKVKDYYMKIHEIDQLISDKKMTGFTKKIEGVTRTDYENNISVYVNTTISAVDWGGHVIPAKDYLITINDKDEE